MNTHLGHQVTGNVAAAAAAAAAASNSTKKLAAAEKVKLIDPSDIQQHDVLLGMGAVCASHVGSIAFKAIVESRMNSYISSEATNKDKTILTLDVLDMIRVTGARFLRKERKPGSDFWYELSLKEARVNIRDAFRDIIKNIRNNRLPSQLLSKLGLSELLNSQSTYKEIVEFVLKSTDIRDYIVSRNDVIEKRKKKRLACFLKQNPEYAETPSPPSPTTKQSSTSPPKSKATKAVKAASRETKKRAASSRAPPRSKSDSNASSVSKRSTLGQVCKRIAKVSNRNKKRAASSHLSTAAVALQQSSANSKFPDEDRKLAACVGLTTAGTMTYHQPFLATDHHNRLNATKRAKLAVGTSRDAMAQSLAFASTLRQQQSREMALSKRTDLLAATIANQQRHFRGAAAAAARSPSVALHPPLGRGPTNIHFLRNHFNSNKPPLLNRERYMTMLSDQVKNMLLPHRSNNSSSSSTKSRQERTTF